MQTSPGFEFVPEKCAYCDGWAALPGGLPCYCCKGQGVVLVQQPSKPCPSCSGSGKAGAQGSTSHCPHCAGRGWLNTKIITAMPT
jgi:DnaJ-class molecular chaperone